MGAKPFYKLQTPAYFWMQGSNVTQSSADPFWKLAPHPNDVILQQLRLCRSLLFQGIRDYLVMTFAVEGQVLLWLCTISVLLTIELRFWPSWGPNATWQTLTTPSTWCTTHMRWLVCACPLGFQQAWANFKSFWHAVWQEQDAVIGQIIVELSIPKMREMNRMSQILFWYWYHARQVFLSRHFLGNPFPKKPFCFPQGAQYRWRSPMILDRT